MSLSANGPPNQISVSSQVILTAVCVATCSRCFFEGAPPYDARQGVHGTFFVLELPKSHLTLPLTQATLACFTTACFTTASPQHARDPMAEEAWWLFIHALFESYGRDGRHAALAVSVSFEGCLRPSEVLSICSIDVHVLS